MKFGIQALLVVLVLQFTQVREAEAGRVGRALVGGLIGAAIGAALVHHYNKNKRRGTSRQRRRTQPDNRHVYPRKEGGWLISYDEGAEVCMASSEYEKGTTFHVGVNGNSGDWFFSYNNPNWTSIVPGNAYPITYVFDGRRTRSGNSTGIENGLMQEGIESSFIEEFARSSKLEILFNNQRVDHISLKGTRRATDAIKHCQRTQLADAAPAPVPATSQPFAAKPPAAEPAKVPAPAPALAAGWDFANTFGTDVPEEVLGLCTTTHASAEGGTPFTTGIYRDGRGYIYLEPRLSAEQQERLHAEQQGAGAGIELGIAVDDKPERKIKGWVNDMDGGFNFDVEAYDELVAEMSQGKTLSYYVPKWVALSSIALEGIGEQLTKVLRCRDEIRPRPDPAR